ncbi:MAG: saccharopine dehydrogenase C-terminal domain-containing protein [Candidatus Omnitrophica bacterium]|nr:saccharopine dehydrogenase C-terminal domain-containing protein [Candidatus Omnitrophota bacterium]
MVFTNKILIIGYGAVAKSVLPILLRHIKIPYKNITIIDFLDKKNELTAWMQKGVRFYQERITPQNITRVLFKYVGAGSLIIDLAWNIDCIDILQWAHNNKVLYVNASIEEWDPYSDIHTKTSLEKSLYHRYVMLSEVSKEWNSTTAVVDHGANPGLISHFVKQGLVDIAEKIIRQKKVSLRKAKTLERLIKNEEFARLAMEIGVKVIHSSERDTQVSNRTKVFDEFVNVWSIEGIVEESIAPVEIGWGTHENELPKFATRPVHGPKNQIILPQMGINTLARSWVPDQEFVGMIITHGEAYGISKMLTVQKGKEVIYRPTVHYVYLPANEVMSSLHDLRCRGYELPVKKRIMNDEITMGADILGALIMGYSYNSWWTGSVMDIEESRSLVAHQNATTIQVAIGVVSAIKWMINNPNKGLCYPEDLPYKEVLFMAKPYLGKFLSQPINWTPVANYQVFFKDNPEAQLDEKDVWQFKNFLFRP